jgi:septum formation protein
MPTDAYGGTGFILASRSARRAQLLREAGYRFQVVPSRVDESLYKTQGILPSYYAEQLALAKAKDVAQQYPDTLVLGADTIVDCQGQIMGKPADAEDAEAITRRLFSRPHKVITGLALVLLDKAIEIVESDTTVVYPKPMTDQQIQVHIEHGTWQGKAGAYAIQETGDMFVDRLEGSLTNVIGLPMERLARLLEPLWHP